MLKTEFESRRQRLIEKMAPDSFAILTAAPEMFRNADTHYRYRQNSDFYYLTGFNEPEAVAVFIPNRKEGAFILFNRPHDRAQEVWTGFRVGQENACKEYGADQAFSITELNRLMPEILSNAKQIYCHIGKDLNFDQQLMNWLNRVRNKSRAGIDAPSIVVELDQILTELRLIKSHYEIDLMQKAAEISVSAHRRAMQVCRPGLKEYEIEAELCYEFLRHGCQSPAYPSIVAGGKNACVLHYSENNQILNDGELLLVDAGGEYLNYASDITRTFPINGKFTAEQRAIYEIVLEAQLAAINAVKPGNPWNAMQEIVVEVIVQGLVNLNILRGRVTDLIANKAYFPYYMHFSGHWLGLDTHDVGAYQIDKQWRKLVPGMVLTVEPGIYISGDNPDVDPRWWNIGVRIEDDVLVTDSGCKVLSGELQKQIADIENLMA